MLSRSLPPQRYRRNPVPGSDKHGSPHPQAPIEWEFVDVTPIIKDGRTAIPDAAIESIKRNFVALKGPLAVCGLINSPNGALC